MSTNRQNRSILSNAYVFVLWGHGFDEAVAILFVTELRKAGWLVQIVGVTPQIITGAHGVALVPDLTLDQALPLAAQAICVVIPSTFRWAERYYDDPRLYKFMQQATLHHAKFVIGQFDETLLSNEAAPPILTSKNILVYPDIDNMVAFTRKTITILSKASTNP